MTDKINAAELAEGQVQYYATDGFVYQSAKKTATGCSLGFMVCECDNQENALEIARVLNAEEKLSAEVVRLEKVVADCGAEYEALEIEHDVLKKENERLEARVKFQNETWDTANSEIAARGEVIARLEARVKELEDFADEVKVYADCYKYNSKIDGAKDYAVMTLIKMGDLAKAIANKKDETP